MHATNFTLENCKFRTVKAQINKIDVLVGKDTERIFEVHFDDSQLHDDMTRAWRMKFSPIRLFANGQWLRTYESPWDLVLINNEV